MTGPLLKPKDAEGRKVSSKAEWRKLRNEVFKRALGFCENSCCRRDTPLNQGHVHHLKRRGLGGGKRDDNNVIWLCEWCHAKAHE
ncbi:MAG: hypothetical protein WAM79_11475 [Candidatus Sulfotelmatobacter sp.]